MDITDPETTSLLWATQANAYVCTAVMPQGLTPIETVDLSGAYYTAAIPIVEIQIARAGYR
jgi:hypothetical protein